MSHGIPIPPRPELITDEMRRQAERLGINPNAPLPRERVAMILAMYGDTSQQLLRDRLGLDVTITTRPTGITISADIPQPAEPDGRDDIALPS